jgi:hypothetical protein
MTMDFSQAPAAGFGIVNAAYIGIFSVGQHPAGAGFFLRAQSLAHAGMRRYAPTRPKGCPPPGPPRSSAARSSAPG